MIYLDFGSGETCKNDVKYAFRMIDELPKTDKGIAIKWQLFTDIPPLTPLDREVYLRAREYAHEKGYKTGSSFFDRESLDFLLNHNADFVKMAARPHLYHLLEHIPPWMPMVISVPTFGWYVKIRAVYPNATVLCCIADYPAVAAKYENAYGEALHYGISDHTTDWYLYNRYQPIEYECHYCLDDSTGPDAAEFARRPEDLEVIF